MLFAVALLTIENVATAQIVREAGVTSVAAATAALSNALPSDNNGQTAAGMSAIPRSANDTSAAPYGGAQGTQAISPAVMPVNETAQPLKLADVIASVYRAFPLIEQARLERARAHGQLVEAYGAYDTKLQGYTLSEPTGFYRNYRNGIGLARQTWWGGYLSAGYRIGRGEFQPWYKERETNEAGEFKVAVGAPLLQGRAIDAQRVAVFQASLAGQAAAPLVQQSILTAAREAANHYWEWVAAGAVWEAQRELLTLAEKRGEQYTVGVNAGKFAEIDLIFNDQLIAERRGKVLETEQKFRATSYKLSIFLRDEFGQTMVPADDWLPHSFPEIEPLQPSDFQTDLADALARRPEPLLLQFEQRQILLEQQLARNQLLPQLDVVGEASQDVGTPTSSSNDKGQFELVVGLQGEVPIQRRKARGKIQSTSAKMAQIEQKLNLQRDKIGAELQTAYNALQLTSQIVEQSEAALRAAFDSLLRYRFAFERGKVDLIYINLLESKANETEIKLVEAQRNWFAALAEMQAALGLDPLDQAMLISALPRSERPGPGNLPKENSALNPEQLDIDWKKHQPSTTP